jgi:two-component system response regulator YesN
VLTDIRLRRAKALLQDTNLTINEIVSACGFRDLLYFSRLFHKTTGQPPRNFRGDEKYG